MSFLLEVEQMNVVHACFREQSDAGGACNVQQPRQRGTLYFFMLSLDIVSLDMVSLDIVSFFIESLDIVSFFIESFAMLSFDIVSFFIMSSAKAGAPASASEMSAAMEATDIRVRVIAKSS
jgi:hypothetical protein